MSAARLHLRDFALEAQVSPAGNLAYSDAQVDAIRRQAFADGELHGRAAANAATESLEIEHAAALHRLVREAAGIRSEADELVGEALRCMEAILVGVLDKVMRGTAAGQGVEDLRSALRQAAMAVRLPDIELRATSETIASLEGADPPLPLTIRMTSCPETPGGEVRLTWCGGGGIVQSNLRVQATQAALARVLDGWPSCGAVAESVHRSDTG